MSERYVVRPGARGHGVFDLVLGQFAEIAGTLQTSLSAEDAEHLAGLLNRQQDETTAVA